MINRYWAFRNLENGKRPQGEQTRLGVRAQKKSGSVRIEWFKIRIVTQDGQTYSDHIRKGSNRHKYPKHVLERNAKPWEREKVLECEEQFAEIREAAGELVKIRSARGSYGKRRGCIFLGGWRVGREHATQGAKKCQRFTPPNPALTD
ncbi:MAG: conjugative transfer protein MobI(A/C) [Thiohalorhabdaceae bacterium]